MAVTFTPDIRGSGASPVALAGGYWLVAGTLTFSGSYAAGGDTFDFTKLFPAMGVIRKVWFLTQVRGFTAEYDVTNKKIKLWVATATTPTTAEHGAAAYDSDFTGSPVDTLVVVK